ncbi:HEPN domain-containing protein [Serratia marcescens]|uniref:HEPN domain-containing protein n=1 Tax=Serratia marcescens TaxID=615 RepID=UPI00236070DF|nr:HEPN domain-containing protein [Serratia marcescens]
MSTAKFIFDNAWLRCDLLSLTYAYTSANLSAVFDSREILRAEWVARVSALDLYIHELVAQNMLEIFQGVRVRTAKYDKFTIPHSVMSDIFNAPHTRDQTYDLEVRRQLGIQTYQTSDSIADGIRLISDVALWREVAMDQGATNSTADSRAKAMKLQLNAIVERRNKIAHEGDMKPLTPREPWPITGQDLVVVKNFIEALVNSIDKLI